MVVPGAAFCIAGCLAACLALLTQQGAAQNVRALRMDTARTAQGDAGAVMRFDIPSKSLQDALDDFDAVTGFSGLYSADAVALRQSVALHGTFTAQIALHKLLEQSGLRSYFTARDAYVLEADAGSSASPTPVEPDAPDSNEFETLLQSTVRTAFCRNALIVPGQYRIALSFRVTANGRVEQARLLDTTGSKVRDVEILRSLRGIRFPRGPANSTEPFVMLILPREQVAFADCGASP